MLGTELLECAPEWLGRVAGVSVCVSVHRIRFQGDQCRVLNKFVPTVLVPPERTGMTKRRRRVMESDSEDDDYDDTQAASTAGIDGGGGGSSSS